MYIDLTMLLTVSEDHLLKAVVSNVVVGVIILIAVSHLLLQLDLALDQVLNLTLSDF